MSDDRIIDFNELKNKIKDSDVDKFENHMYNLYISVVDGSMTMFQFTEKISEYMRENNISESKFMKMQNKLMERYGLNPTELENQVRNMGINLNNLSSDDLSEFNQLKTNLKHVQLVEDKIEQSSDFFKKYGSKCEKINHITTELKDDVNDIKIIINEGKVTLISEGSINLVDAELNELLLSYKSMYNDKIKVIICENCKEYDY